MKFPLLIEPLLLPLGLPFGITQENAYVELNADSLHLRFGWLLDEAVEIEAIDHAEKGHWPFYYGLGVRIGLQGEYGVVGSTRNIVSLTFKEPTPLTVIGPLRPTFKSLHLSLKEPKLFLRAMEAHLA